MTCAIIGNTTVSAHKYYHAACFSSENGHRHRRVQPQLPPARVLRQQDQLQQHVERPKLIWVKSFCLPPEQQSQAASAYSEASTLHFEKLCNDIAVVGTFANDSPNEKLFFKTSEQMLHYKSVNLLLEACISLEGDQHKNLLLSN